MCDHEALVADLTKKRMTMRCAATCLSFTDTLLAQIRARTEDGKFYHLDYAEPFSHVTLHEVEAPCVGGRA